MPTKTTVGLCRTTNHPVHGSVEASCYIELDLNAGLLKDDPDTLHQQLQAALAACHHAVEQQLAHHQATLPETLGESPASQPASTAANGDKGNGRPYANGSSSRRDPGRSPQSGAQNNSGHTASEKQLAYLTQLARRIPDLEPEGVDRLAQQQFGRPAPLLTSQQASSLIDLLKRLKSRELALEDVSSFRS